MDYLNTYDVTGYNQGGYLQAIRVDANTPEQAKQVALENGIVADYVREVTIEELEQEIIDLYESLRVEEDLD